MQTRVLSLLVALVSLARAGAAPPPKAAPRVVADFTLKDSRGGVWSLGRLKDNEAVVLIFIGTQCPINNSYVPRLNELAKEYAGKGVQVLGVNANVQDSPEDIAEHVRKFAVAFPVLRDERNVLADRLEVWRTPEALIIDKKRQVRYQGRIDDQYGHGFVRPAPTRRDLVEALDEVLAGKDVSEPRTAVTGCYIGRVVKTKKDGDLTYTKHIVPLLQKHCQECHRPGQVGPMPLLTYDDAVSWSRMIHEVVRDKRMPPWHADPRHGKFLNDRSLPDDDRDTLLAWLETDMPRGKDGDLPPPRKFADGWVVGKPDAIIYLPKEVDVPAETPRGGVPYKYFTVETNFDEDKWIERAEAKAGAPEVVHHVLVFIVPPGKRFMPASPDTPVLCGMAPGEQPLFLPPGHAKHLPKGSKLVFQMHYTPNGKAQTDRSYIGLVFARKPPEKKVVTHAVYNLFFAIPPGAKNHRVEASYTFREDAEIVGYMPHMHLRGKDFLVKRIDPAGKEEILLFVPHFNFNWQGIYRPLHPVAMPKGTKLICIAHFDNSKDNPGNPDPTATVGWGDQTWQEMMVGWFDFAFDREKK